MRLARFAHPGGPRLGRVEDDGVVDLAQAAPELPRTLAALLAAGEEALAVAREAAGPRLALDDLALLSPVGGESNVLAVGLNYADHARETGREPGPLPACFAKLPGSLAGPHDDVARSAGVTTLDYEAELGVVVGREGRQVAEADAMAHVAGYLVANDVTAREAMAPDRLILGKAGDGFAPLGPWFTTADAVPDPHALAVRSWVDGEPRQDSSTAQMIHRIPALIALFSRTITLRPGDVILTGSPAGSGAGFTPPRWLQPGQVAEVEVEGLGRLRNRIVAPDMIVAPSVTPLRGATAPPRAGEP